jgi:serine protease Do
MDSRLICVFLPGGNPRNGFAASFMKPLRAAILSAIMAPGIFGGPLAIHAADPPGLALARQLNDAFVSVADQVSPSVVILEVTEKPRFFGRGRFSRQQQGEGSGIIVTADGYILTNDHVVNNADTNTNGIIVQLQNGRRFPAKVVGTDPRSDIAVVKIDPKGAKLSPARLGDSSKLRVGEFVVAIGHPLDLTFSVTVGHISALQRLVPRDADDTLADEPDYIQTDAVINPGNSGGPLINLDGEVVGINDMIEAYTDRLTGETVNVGIGLAIPVNVAKAVKDILISRGKFVRSRIGIVMGSSQDPDQLLSPGLKPVSNRPAGIEVTDIVTGSPASRSGLKIGDIIVAVDDTPVITARDLYREISFKNPGQSIAVNVLRKEKPFTIKVTTEAVPELQETAAASPPAVSSPEAEWGFTVKDLTKDLANKFGLTASSGVIVTDVQSAALANRSFNAGGVITKSPTIAPGDIITKLNNKSVTNAKDFIAALKAIAPGQQWTLELSDKDGLKFKVLRDPRPPAE